MDSYKTTKPTHLLPHSLTIKLPYNPIKIQEFHPQTQHSSLDEMNLPPGWQQAFDHTTRQFFYIDHNTQKTTWQAPVLQNSGSLKSLPTPSSTSSSSASDLVKHEIMMIRKRVELLELDNLLNKELESKQKEYNELLSEISALELDQFSKKPKFKRRFMSTNFFSTIFQNKELDTDSLSEKEASSSSGGSHDFSESLLLKKKSLEKQIQILQIKAASSTLQITSSNHFSRYHPSAPAVPLYNSIGSFNFINSNDRITQNQYQYSPKNLVPNSSISSSSSSNVSRPRIYKKFIPMSQKPVMINEISTLKRINSLPNSPFKINSFE